MNTQDIRERKFSVSARHVVAKYSPQSAIAVCKPYPSLQGPVLWYATMRDFGCSKNYRTPEAAIFAMLSDHACTDITVKPIEA